MKIRLTNETFILRAKEKHGEKYNYDLLNFTNVNSKIKIICPKHGVFTQIAHSHLSGCGCAKCNFDKLSILKPSTTEDFILKSKKIHNNKYDYSLVVYINDITKVNIICDKHGLFTQTPHNHKRGNGCRLCANNVISKSARENSRGWSLTDWENRIKSDYNSKPTLYIIKCFNEDETFIKIGITMRTIKKRFQNKNLMPYKYEILFQFFDKPEIIFNKEIEIKKKLKSLHYKPKLKFSGWNECFKLCEIELNNL